MTDWQTGRQAGKQTDKNGQVESCISRYVDGWIDLDDKYMTRQIIDR